MVSRVDQGDVGGFSDHPQMASCFPNKANLPSHAPDSRTRGRTSPRLISLACVQALKNQKILRREPGPRLAFRPIQMIGHPRAPQTPELFLTDFHLTSRNSHFQTQTTASCGNTTTNSSSRINSFSKRNSGSMPSPPASTSSRCAKCAFPRDFSVRTPSPRRLANHAANALAFYCAFLQGRFMDDFHSIVVVYGDKCRLCG
jgi:hypothetical protein